LGPDHASKIDTKPGATRHSRAANGYCQAHGGWYITARELANARMVWSFTIGDKAIDNNFHYKEQQEQLWSDPGSAATVV
jgi:hypothetical protein